MRVEDLSIQQSLTSLAQFAIGQAMAHIDPSSWDGRAIRVVEDLTAEFRPHDKALAMTSKRLRVTVEIL